MLQSKQIATLLGWMWKTKQEQRKKNDEHIDTKYENPQKVSPGFKFKLKYILEKFRKLILSARFPSFPN